MKTLILVDSYADSNRKKKELKNCIESLKATNFDILLTSHLPVDNDIQNSVDYFIYDKNNLLLPFFTKLWVANDTFYAEYYTQYHAPAICLNMYNGFNFAKLHTYEFVVYISSDCIFSQEDSKKLTELVNFCVGSNKKGFFFNPQDWLVELCSSTEMGKYLWETLIFGFSVEDFLIYFDPPKSLDEYQKLNCPEKTLEINFFSKLQCIGEQIHIIPEWSKNFFNQSKIDLSAENLIFCDLVYNKTNPESLIFLVLAGSRATNFSVKLCLNDTTILESSFNPDIWYFREFQTSGEELKIELFFEGEIINTKKYILENQLLESIKMTRNFFEFTN